MVVRELLGGPACEAAVVGEQATAFLPGVSRPAWTLMFHAEISTEPRVRSFTETFAVHRNRRFAGRSGDRFCDWRTFV